MLQKNLINCTYCTQKALNSLSSFCFSRRFGLFFHPTSFLEGISLWETCTDALCPKATPHWSPAGRFHVDPVHGRGMCHSLGACHGGRMPRREGVRFFRLSSVLEGLRRQLDDVCHFSLKSREPTPTRDCPFLRSNIFLIAKYCFLFFKPSGEEDSI